MPTFSNVTVETSVDIDFEVYCGTCGAGLCLDSSTRESRNRSFPQVVVNVCETCIGKKEEEIEDLKYQLEELQREVESLQTV